jgi:hypothetical protein
MDGLKGVGELVDLRGGAVEVGLLDRAKSHVVRAGVGPIAWSETACRAISRLEMGTCW